jgi:hypothetical protein
MISSRYALPVILMISLALVPTVIHSYMQARVDDGKITANISTTLNGMSSQPFTRHNAEWVKGMFDSEDWIERIYRTDSGNKTRLFVARSYDHKRLYHHPELGLSHGSDLSSEGVVELPGETKMPVHLLRNSNRQGLVAYVLLYDGRFIRDPLKHQIGDSLKLLVSPRRPMTMFYIDAGDSSAKQEFAGTTSARLLTAAIRSFTAQKKSGGRP